MKEFPRDPNFKPDPTRPLRTYRLWMLLEDALEDCRAHDTLVRNNPRHWGWDMDEWITFYRREDDPKTKCTVCMAGAVLARRGLSSDREAFVVSDSNWLTAIDEMRNGNFTCAYADLYKSNPDKDVTRGLIDVCLLFERLKNSPVERGRVESDDEEESGRLSWCAYDVIVEKLRELNL